MSQDRALFLRRDYSKEHHCELLNLDNFSSEKPIVLCLGGNATTTPSSANGFCKLPEHQLKLMFDGRDNSNVLNYVDLIGVSYPLANNSMFGRLAMEDVADIVDKMLMPRLLDKDGNKLTLDIACKNFSQVTFFSFCHGQSEAYYIGYELMCKLRNVGYTLTEVDKILNSTMHICYAGVNPKDIFPTVRVDSGYDRNNNMDWFVDGAEYFLGHELDGIETRIEHKGDATCCGKSHSIRGCLHIYSSKLRNDTIKDFNEHAAKLMDRDENWNARMKDTKGNFIELGKNGDCVSQMMSWALCRAVENGLINAQSDTYIPKQTYEELKAELDSIQMAYTTEELMGPGFGDW